MSIYKSSDHYGRALSHIHDTGFAGVAEAAADMLISALKDSQLSHGRVTDLGCGSGTLARKLLDQGYAVESQSDSMLALARVACTGMQYSGAKRCSSARSRPRLLYVLLANVLTTSSTATMTTRRWTAYYTACISHWKSGGIFLFDIATPDRIVKAPVEKLFPDAKLDDFG